MSPLNKRSALAFLLLFGGGAVSATLDNHSLFVVFGVAGGCVWLSINTLKCIYCGKSLFGKRSSGYWPVFKDACPHCKKKQNM